MESQDQNAQRTEGSAGSGHSTGASHVPRAPSPSLEPEHRPQVKQIRCGSVRFLELRRLGAVDFYGTTDPAEAGTWLKRTVRVLGRMNCTFSEQLDLVESLLRGEAYDWCKVVQSITRPSSILTCASFVQQFRDRYMPEVVKNRNHLDFLNLSQGTLTVGEYEYQFARLARDAPMLVAREDDLC